MFESRISNNLLSLIVCSLGNYYGVVAAENEPADDHQTDTDTIQHWRKHCSKVAVNLAFFNPEPIGGQGAIVEIDESKYGKRNFFHFLCNCAFKKG